LAVERDLYPRAVADGELWLVRIALDPDEVEPIQAAILAVASPLVWGMVLPGAEDEALPILQIEVPAEQQGVAEVEGRELYAQARARAGLAPDGDPQIAVLSAVPAAAPYERLLDEAEALIDRREYDWAVVRSQTACEVYAALALDRIAGDIGEDRRVFRKIWLGDRADRARFRDLTGAEIAQQPWWPSYHAHVLRRNAIVHQGVRASERQAVGSIQAAREFIGFLQDRWKRQSQASRGPRLAT
jgi:hypothetical protein